MYMKYQDNDNRERDMKDMKYQDSDNRSVGQESPHCRLASCYAFSYRHMDIWKYTYMKCQDIG